MLTCEMRNMRKNPFSNVLLVIFGGLISLESKPRLDRSAAAQFDFTFGVAEPSQPTERGLQRRGPRVIAEQGHDLGSIQPAG